MDRRTFLRTSSLVAIGAIALGGCSSPGPGAENGTDPDDDRLETQVGDQPMIGTDETEDDPETESGDGDETNASRRRERPTAPDG